MQSTPCSPVRQQLRKAPKTETKVNAWRYPAQCAESPVPFSAHLQRSLVSFGPQKGNRPGKSTHHGSQASTDTGTANGWAVRRVEFAARQLHLLVTIRPLTVQA